MEHEHATKLDSIIQQQAYTNQILTEILEEIKKNKTEQKTEKAIKQPQKTEEE